MLTNTEQSYGNISKYLHWLLVILVLIQAFSALITIYFLPKNSPLAGLLIGKIHKPFGVITLIVAILAILWRLFTIKPVFPNTMPQWEKTAARWVHALLYLCLIILPVTGILMSDAGGKPVNLWGVFIFPSILPQDKTLSKVLFDIHQITAFVFIGLVVVHILAAIKHHVYDKDNVLRRMWF